MSFPAGISGHHSESIDPTLWNWIRHQIDEIFGLTPTAIVAVIGVIAILIPVMLITIAVWRKRSSYEDN